MSAVKTQITCLLCERAFPISACDSGAYFGQTGICRECYTTMQENGGICFGKKNKYDEEADACASFCPDKEICKAFCKSISKRKSS